MCKYLKAQLLDHMVSLCTANIAMFSLHLVRNCQNAFQSVLLFAFSPKVNESAYSCISSSASDVVRVLGLTHSNRCVVFHCCFNLQFSHDIWSWFFSYANKLWIFFGEIYIFLSIFKIRLFIFLLFWVWKKSVMSFILGVL